MGVVLFEEEAPFDIATAAGTDAVCMTDGNITRAVNSRIAVGNTTERSHTRVHVCNLVTKKRVHTRVYSAHACVQLVCNSWVLNSTGIKYTFIYQLIFKMYMYYFSALFSILDQHRLILTRNPIKQVRTCPTTQPTWQCLCWSLQPWKTCLLQRQCAGGQHKWCFLNQV